jgi:hypothetical protein
MTAQASSGSAFLITDAQSHRLVMHVYLRFDTTTDDVNSPGCTDQSVHQGISENHGFHSLQSSVRLNRGQDGFSHASIDLSRMSGGADKSVIEDVVYTRQVIEVVLSRRGNCVLRDSFGAMGLASIQVIKAAKKPMLWKTH